jgi:hypothetical protein
LLPLNFAKWCYASVAGARGLDLEQILQIGLHGDTGRVHRALEVRKQVPIGIIVIDRKGPDVFITAMVQVNFFADLTSVCQKGSVRLIV